MAEKNMTRKRLDEIKEKLELVEKRIGEDISKELYHEVKEGVEKVAGMFDEIIKEGVTDYKKVGKKSKPKIKKGLKKINLPGSNDG